MKNGAKSYFAQRIISSPDAEEEVVIQKNIMKVIFK